MFNLPVETNLLFELYRRGRAVTAQIGAVERLDEPTWVLMFPDYPSYRGLVPLSQSGVEQTVFYAMVGQTVHVIIKGIDTESNNVACSRQEAVDMVSEQVIAQVQQDDLIPVTVVAVVSRETKPVLIVDIGQGVLLEIPRSKAAMRFTRPLRQQYRAGQSITAKVTATQPLTLSIRAAQPDAWARADYRRGSIISGTIFKINNDLVFIEPDLSPGILGLAPVPLLGNVARSMRVSCRVRHFDKDNKKLHLWLIKQL